MREPFFCKALRISMCVVFVLGLTGAVSLPFMTDRYYAMLGDPYFARPGYRMFITVFLILTAAICLFILAEMILMLRTVKSGPFVLGNTRALYRIGILFFVLAAMFLGKCLWYITLLTFLCGFLFIGGGLFAFTLAALIRQAIELKEENELTI